MNKKILKKVSSKPATILIRREQFCASHRLYNPDYDEKWNKKIYGKCSGINGHGHNYILEVCAKGIPDPKTGMIINLQQLKSIVQEKILNKVDHYHLNCDVPFLQDINPTTENVALAFWDELEPAFPSGMLFKLRLWETEKNSVEIMREDND